MKIAVLRIMVALGCFRSSIEVSAHSLRSAGSLPMDSSAKFTRKEVLASDRKFWGEMAKAVMGESTRLELRRMKASKLLQLTGIPGSHQGVGESIAAAELAPEVAKLDSLYEDSTKRIGQLNQHEAQSKQLYALKQHEDHEKMAAIETKVKGHQEESYFMKYWGRVRERNQKQFHTCLKIQQGLMDRLKSMREAYQQAERQAAAGSTQQPDVAAAALIQHRALIQHPSFVKEALEDVKALHIDLASWD